jgi:hypothetical protein
VGGRSTYVHGQQLVLLDDSLRVRRPRTYDGKAVEPPFQRSDRGPQNPILDLRTDAAVGKAKGKLARRNENAQPG